MSIKITLKNFGEETTTSPEKQAAELLAARFRIEFENDKYSSGEILILSNLTLIGQEVKDLDILVIGMLDNCKFNIITKSKGLNDVINVAEAKVVEVKTFCYTIELKDHIVQRIKTNGPMLLVEYKNHWHDVSTQSEKQKYSLKNYFTDNLEASPYICNFIWLRNVTNQEYSNLFEGNQTNIFPTEFSFKDLIQKSTYQQLPFQHSSANNCIINNISREYKNLFDKSKVLTVFNLFEQSKKASGTFTRQKVELLTRKILEEQKYIQTIGAKLTVLAGRAGTGKTVRLLQIAIELAKKDGSRCLILTYNHALVSDIRRVLAFVGIPDAIDSYTIQISTLHTYFIKLLNGFGVIQGGIISNNTFVNTYIQKVAELLLYLQQKIISEEDIINLKIQEQEQVAWDYILIDEAQDWSDNEKQILFKIYGAKRIIIADGIDQFIRIGKKQDWTRGLKANVDYNKKTETTGLRQKYNLVNFINTYAEITGLGWKVTPNNSFVGGKIIISTASYSPNFHNELFEDCIKNGNAAYDMLFLAPPQLIDRSDETNIHFSKIKAFKQNGIHLFDGTNPNLRNKYPVNLNECRLFQYDSCRGLEGWTVVCLHFDELIKYKLETFTDSDYEQLALETPEDKRRKFVFLWSLMPLTRAIDTLVITIKEKESETAKILRSLSEDLSDIVKWVE